MLTDLLLPVVPGLRLDTLTTDNQTITISLTATAPTATCPLCALPSRRIHSRYTRTVADLPWACVPIRLTLHVRRFFCDTAECRRAIFTERLNPAIAAYARRTTRLTNPFQQLAWALGGEAGALIVTALGMPASPATLLRIIRSAPTPVRPTPRVLGVDDWSLRRGQTFGTILIDLEQHQPVDLLPERSVESFATWLREHPGVEIISRDRAAVYADGATQGAPNAIQVADRFHLSRNLSEALQRLFDRHPAELRQVAAPLTAQEPTQSGAEIDLADAADHTIVLQKTPAAVPDSPALRDIVPSAPDHSPAPPRSHAEVRYQAVKQLQQQGLGQRAIARQLQLHRRTVRRYMLADRFPERAVGPQSVSTVRPYLPYLLQRWEEGCRERHQLWREICTQGYTGSYASVCRALAHLPSRKREAPSETDTAPTVRPLSARKATWLLMRRPADLSVEEETKRQVLCELCPDAATAYPLVQQFGMMIRTRQVDVFDSWLADAEASGIPELRNFAVSLRRDYAAVRAALELPWSNGQTEGQVNRLKQIKRQMYGRAKLDLLRQRVLGAA